MAESLRLQGNIIVLNSTDGKCVYTCMFVKDQKDGREARVRM